jgi:phospholipid transport system substrate-binding protein
MTQKRNLRFKRNIHQFIALSSLALAGAASAAGSNPETDVRRTAGAALSALAESSNTRALRRMAEREIAPHIDFRRLTEEATGRVWAVATEAQRERLSTEFRRLLLRTYAENLAAQDHRGARLFIEPFREAEQTDTESEEATIRTHISEPGHRHTKIDYQLVREDGGWKLINVAVEEQSLFLKYRSRLVEEARTTGVEGLIATLASLDRLDQV